MGTGEQGEALANLILGEWTKRGYLFRVSLIGGNWPTIDLYVETDDYRTNNTCFALFQIKATSRPVSSRSTLPIRISKIQLNRLASMHCPTYLIGVQEHKIQRSLSKAYVVGVFGDYDSGLGAISTKFELDKEKLLILQDDILNFWADSGVQTFKKQYKSIFDAKK